METHNEKALRRTNILAQHLIHDGNNKSLLGLTPCLSYVSPEAASGPTKFNPHDLRRLLDQDNIPMLDKMYQLFAENKIFWPKSAFQGGKLYTSMDYNSTKEEQREITFRRIMFLRDRGYFKKWLSSNDINILKEKAAMHEAIGIYDHSMGVKLGVHVHLWGGAIKYLGTKRHHEKWLDLTEDYVVAGCFGLTELGHGSNVRGIEAIASYDPIKEEFIINTPCETAQKYWIGGAALHANHTIAFAQLHIDGKNQGVHAFVVQIRDNNGQVLPGIQIGECGHKIGLNGVDNGRIWFNNVRIPRENILNAVSDVTPGGHYESPISDPDQRFAAFMAPLTGGRVTLAVSGVNQSKIGLAIAIRYGLSRRAFSLEPGKAEVLLLDYPSHQRRLLPLLAKTYALNFACNEMKEIYFNRKPKDAKFIHVQTSGYKAMTSWHMLRTLQECREACGGMGVRSDNRIGQLRSEHDVMATFEGDNNVLMQTVSKALLGDFISAKKKGRRLEKKSPNFPKVFDSSLMRNGDFLLTLFQHRELDLLEKFASNISMLNSNGLSMADAFNESYQLATDLGKGHAECEVLESALKVLNSQVRGAIKDTLALIVALYALTLVDEDPVFLRYGYLDPNQACAVHKEVSLLCKEIRPHALALVDAFGLPSHLLAPIAFDWVEANSRRYLEADRSTNGSHRENSINI